MQHSVPSIAKQPHFSVLLDEAVEALLQDPGGLYIDGTFGRGGHSRAILARLNEAGRLTVFDKDPQAIAAARELAQADSRLQVIHESFARLHQQMAEQGLLGQVSGIFLDLGVSSPQLDEAERGFSFLKDGPLDMRMDSTRGMTAAEWVNTVSEQTMTHVLRVYGEEKFAKRIAGAICARRIEEPFSRTTDLAAVVAAANPKWERGKNPATRVFQAIRIAVNGELDDLEQTLNSALEVLKPGGRLVVISFHSLEDRLVKRFFKDQARGEYFPPGVPVTADQLNPGLRIVGKPVRASDGEVQQNVRSRSAIMRVAEKIASAKSR